MAPLITGTKQELIISVFLSGHQNQEWHLDSLSTKNDKAGFFIFHRQNPAKLKHDIIYINLKYSENY